MLLRSLAVFLFATHSWATTVEIPASAKIQPLVTAQSATTAPALPIATPLQSPEPLAATALPVLEQGVVGLGQAQAQPDADQALSSAQAQLGALFDGSQMRSLDSIEDLNVGAYNMENLFEMVGKHEVNLTNGHLDQLTAAQPKPAWKMAEQGKLILENKLDVMVVEEVEDIKALEDFNQRYLGGAYQTFLIEGNDERGIDIAFLVKKDLPFKLEQRSHKDEKWTNPATGQEENVFSRDLTSLIFRAPGQTDPLFVLFGTHYKSKRDAFKDPGSNIKRGAQVARTAQIMARYKKEFGDGIAMMLGGDYNGDVPREAEYKPLFQAAGLTDAFDASPNPPSDRDRITHTFHPRGEPAHMSQMDALLVSTSLRGVVRDAFVYRYKNADGSVRPLPTTYDEREKNPSDHFPVIVKLAFQPILKRVFPPWTPAPKAQMTPQKAAAELAAAKARWLNEGARTFSAALKEWKIWAADPGAWVAAKGKQGYIDRYTSRNVREIVTRLATLEKAERAFSASDEASAAAAWKTLKYATQSLFLLGNSRHPDPKKAALIADSDQKRGHHPDGYPALQAGAGLLSPEAAAVLK